jgi:hypothetical protein
MRTVTSMWAHVELLASMVSGPQWSSKSVCQIMICLMLGQNSGNAFAIMAAWCHPTSSMRAGLLTAVQPKTTQLAFLMSSFLHARGLSYISGEIEAHQLCI